MIRFANIALDELFRRDTSPVHDELVLIADAMRHEILGYAEQCGWVQANGFLLPFAGNEKRLEVALEVCAVPELVISHEPELVADLALFEAGELRLVLEIKSQREAQSASSWLRQTAKYEWATGVPSVLVVAHDLDQVIARYLTWAGVRVIDLRKL